MTPEQAIKILDHETSREAVSVLKYYAGFERRVVLEQIQEAMDMGAEALRRMKMKRINLYDNNGNLIPDPCLLDDLNKMLIEYKVTIRGMSGEKLIITDQISGEEYVVEDLGYPF